MLDDTVIVALVPGLVEVAKRSGLPSRFAPVAALAIALVLATLSHLATETGPMAPATIARLILIGAIDGLAAIGLYRLMPKPANASETA